MKTLIKSARLYSAKLPDADLVAGHLQEKKFAELTSMELAGVGFVPCANGEYIHKFVDGFAFTVRMDAKVIPASTLKAETDKLIADIEKAQGCKPGKKQRKELKEQALDSLIPRAFIKTAELQAFYYVPDNLLIVPTSSNSVADTVTGLLIQAIGSVETQTLHVAEVKHGLTTRLAAALGIGQEDPDEIDQDFAFGAEFDLGDTVTLSRKLEGKAEKLLVQMSSLEQATDAIREALAAQFGVTAIRLQSAGVDFTLTHEFNLRGLAYESEPDREEPIEDAWAHEAAIETMLVARIVRSLLELLAYKAPEQDEKDTPVDPDGYDLPF